MMDQADNNHKPYRPAPGSPERRVPRSTVPHHRELRRDPVQDQADTTPSATRLVVLRQGLNSLDALFSSLFQSIDPLGRFGRMLLGVSHSADGWLYPLLACAFYFGLKDGQRFLMHALVAYPLQLILQEVLKRAVRRVRPFERFSVIHRRIGAPDIYSFPSGHTANAVTMSMLVVLHAPALSVPAVLWGMLVGVSRIALGVHYATDVIAGALLGVACVLFTGIWML